MLLMWGFMSSDVGLTLGTNCKKLKTKDWGGGGGIASASVHVIMSGGQQGAYCWVRKKRPYIYILY